MAAIEHLHDFMQTRLPHPDTRTINLLNSSLGAWLRYYGFLTLIRNRYEEANAPYMDAMERQLEAIKKETAETNRPEPRFVTPEEWEEMQKTTELGKRLHLEIESFFIFANILLDRIACTVRYYFWRRSDWNHWQLAANLENICKKKAFTVPSDDFLRLPGELQEKVVSYRNTRVEHVEEPHLRFATSWGPDKKAKIMPTFLYPTEKEVKELQNASGDLDELLSLLDTYMVAMLDFFDANADKSALPPVAAKPATTHDSQRIS